MFSGKSILTTGGTGSFGWRYTRTLLSLFRPKKVIIFSRDELEQYKMQQVSNMRCFIGDVIGKERLVQVCGGVDAIQQLLLDGEE